jgi:putative ABC transport system ATP-binding protein
MPTTTIPEPDSDPDPGIGIGGQLADDEGPASPVTAGSLVRWVLRRQIGRIIAGALAGIAWMGSIAFLPVALGFAVDRIVDDRSVGSVAFVCGLLGAVTMAQAVAGVVRHRCALLLYTRTRWLVERLVTRRVLDPRGGVDVEPGALLSLAASDAQRVGGIADLMCRGSGAIVTFFGVGAGMLAASPILGGLVLVGLPPCLLVLVPLWRPYDRRATEQQQRLADASAVAADITTGLRVVKGLGSEDGVRRWFAEGTAKVRATAIALARLDSAWKALASAIPALFLALTIWVGGRLALDGSLSAGALVSFTGLALFLAIPLQTFAEVGDVWATGFASARRIAAALETPLAVVDDVGRGDTRTPTAATAQFCAITYGPLTDFDLDVHAGELLGVVAEDPEVATAISDLLVRRADPDRGRVLVGGIDARELPLDTLRAHVVTVDGHHPWLVDATLGENLALGAPHTDRAVLERALLDAAGEDLVARRSGLDQPIGERGLSLSGGQRQRLTVARSFAARPPVLVLDEPTSALDVVTELRLLSRLRDARVDRTTLLVTVSAPALARCDRVVVIESGRVVAEGVHDELMHDLRYRDLIAPDAS